MVLDPRSKTFLLMTVEIGDKSDSVWSAWRADTGVPRIAKTQRSCLSILYSSSGPTTDLISLVQRLCFATLGRAGSRKNVRKNKNNNNNSGVHHVSDELNILAFEFENAFFTSYHMLKGLLWYLIKQITVSAMLLLQKN